jgi:hypothetical protein
MSPYPPGTSASDPRAPWNPQHVHDHEWRPVEDELIIEDGAAIFTEECRYAEGKYGEKWQCEETRHYRFEYNTLETPDGIEIELHDITEWEMNNETVRETVTQIEERHCYVGPGDEETEIDVDPDPKYGHVAIHWNGYTLTYEP